jgi:hypothetical protein
MPEQESEAPLRRSARVNVRIPVKLSGILADNKTFAEDTYVITVSKYGARLLTQQPLKVGMQVKVQPRGRRPAGLFKVVWTGRPGSPREGEIGIAYVNVSNLLGIAFPD